MNAGGAGEVTAQKPPGVGSWSVIVVPGSTVTGPDAGAGIGFTVNSANVEPPPKAK